MLVLDIRAFWAEERKFNTYPFPLTTSSFASCHRLLRAPVSLVSIRKVKAIVAAETYHIDECDV